MSWEWGATHKAMKLNASIVKRYLLPLLLQPSAVKTTATSQRYEKMRLKSKKTPAYALTKKAARKKTVVKTDWIAGQWMMSRSGEKVNIQ